MTFLSTRQIDLQELGIGKEEVAELRAKFDTIAEDWNRPEMDIYDVDLITDVTHDWSASVLACI